ncbi:hypothetical protein ACHQM5_026397 [Ranunculus cassubicifolius]
MPEIVEIGDDSFNNFKSLEINSIEDDLSDDDDDDDDEIMEDDEDDEEQEPVTLGFVKKPNNPFSLLRQLFPSKAGGIPVYAPLPEKESTFHRTLFVFMCPEMGCLLRDQHEQWKRKPEKQSRSVKVFRCQLRRSNPFYSSEGLKRDGTDKPSCDGAALCDWCGTWKGDKVCSGCRSARYCSAKHQVVHWRSGHKLNCQHMSISLQSSGSSSSKGGTPSMEKNRVASTTLWPEFKIIKKDECEYDTETSDNNDSASLVSKNKRDEGISSVMNQFEGDADKKSWASFQERMAKAPEQVLRYSRKAKPLWPMSSGRPSNADIPKCNYCDSDMCFEFQILSQLLYYLKVQNNANSLDWATIVVYTCSNSCEASISYKEEFAWVQISHT